MDMAFERSDWTPTAAGQALLRNNRPLLAYIGGKPARFTSQDHNFVPGETVEKQLILINNSRVTVTCDCEWSLGLPQPVAGSRTGPHPLSPSPNPGRGGTNAAGSPGSPIPTLGEGSGREGRLSAPLAATTRSPQPVTGSRKVILRTGEQERIPLRFELPATLAPGSYEIRAAVRFSSGETQSDSFSVHVLPQAGAGSAVFGVREREVSDPTPNTEHRTPNTA